MVLIATGAICADELLTSTGRSGIGPLGTALAYGLAFGGMFAVFGRISGGHFNPAITIAFWATRRLGTFDSLACCVAQLGGATAAAYALRFGLPDDFWMPARLGAPALAAGITRAPAMMIEGVLTFFLVLAVLAILRREAPSAAGGLAAASILTSAVLFAGPFTGGAINPARALAPALAAKQLANQAVYWIGPIGGGLLAAVLHDLLFRREAPSDKTSS